MLLLKGWLYFAVFLLLLLIGLPWLLTKFSFDGKRDAHKVTSTTQIRLFRKDKNKVDTMAFEEYIKGVVSAEMPVEFEGEALKAQAVAARTYAYGRLIKEYTSKDSPHPDADVCDDSTHCQAWVDFQEVYPTASHDQRTTWKEKITKAVETTSGEILRHQGKVANPLYHANSGGETEDAVEAFSREVPYLKSVRSMGEEVSKDFKTIYVFTVKDLASRLNRVDSLIQLDTQRGLETLQIMERSKTNRVKTMKIGNRVFQGSDLRKILGLRSTKFTISIAEDKAIFTVWGNGHGVGMSQWGANHLAKSGGKYQEILKFYYSGIEIDTTQSQQE